MFLASFATLGNVLNAGAATSLLLAIGGCPTGEDVSLPLGFWSAVDIGGTVCLGPSATTGRITGVDCDVTQDVILTPRVVGFSSESVPPCALGVDRCGSPGVPASSAPVGTPIAGGSSSGRGEAPAAVRREDPIPQGDNPRKVPYDAAPGRQSRRFLAREPGSIRNPEVGRELSAAMTTLSLSPRGS